MVASAVVSRSSPTYAAWSRYWRGNRIASCLETQEGLHPALAQMWREFFDQLREGARILDVGTGNGAVPLAAVRSARDRSTSFEIDAIDSAEIDPQRHALRYAGELGAVRFHGHTDMTAPPFANGAFDAITGQFAIEYADINVAAAALCPLLAPGGRVCFVIRAAEGRPAADGRLDQANVAFLTGEARLVQATRQYLRERQAAGAAPTKNTERARQACEAALQRTRARMAQSPTPLLANAAALAENLVAAQGAYPQETLESKLDELRDEIDAHRLRLQALLDAAMTRERAEEKAIVFARLGLAMAPIVGVSDQGGNLLGWKLSGVLSR